MDKIKLQNLYLAKLQRIKEYTGSGNRTVLKNYVKSLLVYMRMLAQMDVDRFCELCSKQRELERLYHLGETEGVINKAILISVDGIIKQKEEVRKVMTVWGDGFESILDLWQHSGATLDELFNFCNTEPATVKSVLSDKDIGSMSFSQIAFIYNVDYNHYGGYCLELENPAPITHCLKEHHCCLFDKIVN